MNILKQEHRTEAPFCHFKNESSSIGVPQVTCEIVTRPNNSNIYRDELLLLKKETQTDSEAFIPSFIKNETKTDTEALFPSKIKRALPSAIRERNELLENEHCSLTCHIKQEQVEQKHESPFHADWNRKDPISKSLFDRVVKDEVKAVTKFENSEPNAEEGGGGGTGGDEVIDQFGSDDESGGGDGGGSSDEVGGRDAATAWDQSTENPKTISLLDLMRMRWKCDECDDCFKSKRLLRIHEREVHSITRKAGRPRLQGAVGDGGRGGGDRGGGERGGSGRPRVQGGFTPVLQNIWKNSFPKRGRGRPKLQSYKTMMQQYDESLLLSDCDRPRQSKWRACPECDKAFHSDKAIREHMKTHSSADGFRCQYCTETFKTLNITKRHERMHLSSEKFNCEICGEILISKDALIEHNNKKHQIFPCKRCSLSFDTFTDFENHKPCNEFKCKQCDASFDEPHLLTKHALKSHSQPAKLIVDRPRACPHLPKRGPGRPKLQSYGTMQQQDCQECDSASPTCSPNYLKDDSTSQAPTQTKCRFCKCEFLKPEMKKHLRLHLSDLGEMVELELTKPSKGTEGYLFCKYCDETHGAEWKAEVAEGLLEEGISEPTEDEMQLEIHSTLGRFNAKRGPKPKHKMALSSSSSSSSSPLYPRDNVIYVTPQDHDYVSTRKTVLGGT